MMCNKEPLMEPELYILRNILILSVKKLATEKSTPSSENKNLFAKKTFPKKIC